MLFHDILDEWNMILSEIISIKYNTYSQFC